MKAQVSMEMLTTVASVLLMSLPIIFLLLSMSRLGYDKIETSQAEFCARRIAEEINQVYFQGKGAKSNFLINLPQSTREIILNNNEVIIRLSNGYEAVYPFTGKIHIEEDEEKKVFAGRRGLTRFFLTSFEFTESGKPVVMVDIDVE